MAVFLNYPMAWNRVGIGLSHRPARLHRLAELIPWNRFLEFGLCSFFLDFTGFAGFYPEPELFYSQSNSIVTLK